MMKSKPKLERKMQSVSEDLPQAVSKQLDFFTNSTARLQETTKLDKHGRTLTDIIPKAVADKYILEEGEWWYYNKNEKARRRADSQQARQKTKMWVNGKYIPKSHPLHKAGTYKGFEEAAFSSLQNFKNSPQGQVYIITNPAWEGWVKVGMAVDANDRAGNYQTASPYRDYELGYVVETKDRRATETETHARLGDLFEQRNEWFKCSVEMAKRIIDGVVEEEQYDEAC